MRKPSSMPAVSCYDSSSFFQPTRGIVRSHFALFLVVVLVAPTFAQNAALDQIKKNRKPQTVAPAAKPILLHTGKPITPDDRKQVQASALKSLGGKVPGVNTAIKPQVGSAPVARTFTVSPTSLFQPGFVCTELNQPYFVNPETNDMLFLPGALLPSPSGYIDFNILATANTTYTMTFKVTSIGTTSPQYTILPSLPRLSSQPPANGTNASETFAGNTGNDQFAYSFVSNGAGTMYVSIYSPNSEWNFISCEILATPISSN